MLDLYSKPINIRLFVDKSKDLSVYLNNKEEKYSEFSTRYYRFKF